MIELKTNLFDIAKAAALIAIVLMIGLNYGKIFSFFDKKSTDDFGVRITKLEAGLIKLSAKESTERLEQLIKELRDQNSRALKAIDKEGKKVDELTVVVTKLKADSKIQSGDKFKDIDTDEPSTRDFADTVVYRSDSNGAQLPMSRIMYHPYIKENPWTIQNFPLELHTNVVQVMNENGVYDNYVETYFTNNFVKSSKGKKYYFDSDVSWAKREINDKRFRFNLRLGVSGNVATNSMFPGIDLSFASYGKTKRDIDWRFLTVGIGGDSDSVYGYCKPIEYNVGNFIPLIENLFIGPMIGISSDTDVIIGAGLSVLF